MTAAEKLTEELGAELDEMAEKGTLKDLRVYESPQGPEVRLKGLGDVIVLMPMLTTTAEEIDRIVDTVRAAIVEVTEPA